jgi:hypothetical protein
MDMVAGVSWRPAIAGFDKSETKNALLDDYRAKKSK